MRHIQAAPEILNIHLGRTGCDQKTRRKFKTNDTLEVPGFLDVSRYLEQHVFAPGSQVVYRLASVVSQRGDTAQSGHYVSYVRDGGATPSRAAEPIMEAEEVNCVMQESLDLKEHVARECRILSETIMNEDATLAADGQSHLLNEVRREANSQRFLTIERATTLGIPFTRIINTSLDPTYHPDNADWFDPVLLVYEKWIEKYHTDEETGKRIYQLPVNVPNRDYQGPARRGKDGTVQCHDDNNGDAVGVGAAERRYQENIKHDVHIPFPGYATPGH
ncbi:hypothetical protein Sste5344_009025 [Sporothrix stenoceras]